jgi:hypothetical protein
MPLPDFHLPGTAGLSNPAHSNWKFFSISLFAGCQRKGLAQAHCLLSILTEVVVSQADDENIYD